jgi:conjugative relaxase-like TrwC/TraI family protein
MVGMIRINQQSNAAAAKSYYSSPAEYYGAGEQEMIGEWGGQAADRLGLNGTILQHHFSRLCDNLHPFTGEQLTARMKANRRVGYDFNFHVCKSLSILYAVTGNADILAAFRWAMKQVMLAMEQGVNVRVRKRGQFAERAVCNMAWAEFLHFTARPVKGVIDPHLHGHCFVPNICWDHVEGMWKAIDVASAMADSPRWQDMFHRLLGNRLAELGYPVEWKGNTFEIAGIGRDTIERFSSRTTQINRVAEKRGITDPHDKDKLGAMTRERKRKTATMPSLRAEWRQKLTDEERAAIAQAALRQRRPLPDGRCETIAGQACRQASPARQEAERQQRLHDHIMQRQRLAVHERALASCTASRPSPPRPRQSYGR